jgi:hypothetical protein
MNFKILKEEIKGEILKVQCSIEIRNYLEDPIIKIKTSDVVSIYESKYEILQIVKDGEIWNTSPDLKKQTDTWIFKIKKKPTRRRTKSTRATAEKKDPPQKENLQKEKFGSRISNIAKKIQKNQES